ncbi:hypothetical protein FACS189430_11660 [Bacteroidia bacterium]|nr:hypothetical protein FACS189430_11660 [Bacteroidia bacterium]
MKYRVYYKENTLFTWLDLSREKYSAPFKFIIDTGSQCTAISEDTAYDLGFNVSKIKKNRHNNFRELRNKTCWESDIASI